jgi:hypothetical protein
MADTLFNLDEPMERPADAEAQIAEAEMLLAFDVDGGPALARQFHITDLQHWIDLSA